MQNIKRAKETTTAQTNENKVGLIGILLLLPQLWELL
jgi:hypothetical protein